MLIQKCIDKFCQALAFVIVACMALMVVLVFGNVVLRYGFNSGFTLSEELSRWLFVWLTFLGAIVALHERTHLGTDTLVSRLGVQGKKICLGLSYIIMLCLCGMLFVGAIEQTKVNLDSTSPVMEVSMGWFYISGVVFAAFGALIIAFNFWKLVTGKLSEAELVGIQESEEHPHNEEAKH